MPLYEFNCKTCDHTFTLRRSFSQSDDPADCPQCGNENADRQISAPAVFTGNGGERRAVAGSGGCGGCTASASACGSCSVKR